ncbi:hypothetical protein PILCRDRAFT_784283 [Piloderma croceum F 1598]|uniref:Dystroglycan-type cadherin-like domain-containing protein n=1 Tax=Piloderma croceum (strain F 1598) TaxID=765440 RepID=A0A0C3FUM3_PILCF|nr:hypothetical protein PILCRDRAFT_784283 [Piloderma croceum F 1598]
MLVTLLCVLAVAATALASGVSVVIAVDDQLPLIARIGQSYSWAFSPNTFVSSENDGLTYSTSTLPGWLTFDSSARTFQGTPSQSDEGNPEITVTAQDSSSSASCTFTLCVTHFPAPALTIPIAGQFYPNNPSLSSVFMIEQTSALATPNPALRVPPRWSFSIGFEGDTFISENNIYYDVLQADGSPLPSWITFDADSITFNGVTPHEDAIVSPVTLSFALHASDQEGYTASTLPFDLVVALHELSISQGSLPTINITASTPFVLSLSSPADFSGIFIDESPLQPANISALSIDTSQYHRWLEFDEASMTLSGQPPGDLTPNHNGPGPILPVTLTSINQTLHTNISLAIVPSYFLESNLQGIVIDPGDQIRYSLQQDFSNATRISNQQDDVSLTATFDPSQAGQYLGFDSGTALLTGTIPAKSQLDYSHTTVTFTAYSHITHSTSHASLVISFTASKVGPGGIKHGHLTSLSVGARKRLILGLGITFGAIGGLILLTVFLSIFRRCARVRDTALMGEEGTQAWTAEERKWYGIGGAQPPANENPFEPELERQADQSGPYGHLGLGLRRVSPRDTSGHPPTSRSAVMSKSEFVGKVRQTARKVSDKVRMVSDKYTRMRVRRIRPPIGRPVMVTHTGMDVNGLTVTGPPFAGPRVPYAVNPFSDFDGSRGTSLTDSPTSSSGGRSIPVRRADFASPRFGPQRPSPARVQDRRDSVGSLATHAGEATLHTASRATSIRSLNGAHQSENPERPRVVQFTSSTRVPVPKLPSGQLVNGQGVKVAGPPRRIASQTATVFNAGEGRRQESVDGLNLGMHYVNTLGEKLDDAALAATSKVVVTAGEEFRFRVKVATQIGEYRQLEAKLTSGLALPPFIQLDPTSYGADGSSRRAVEFYGVPNPGAIGDYSVGVYTVGDTKPVATVIVKVKGR